MSQNYHNLFIDIHSAVADNAGMANRILSPAEIESIVCRVTGRDDVYVLVFCAFVNQPEIPMPEAMAEANGIRIRPLAERKSK